MKSLMIFILMIAFCGSANAQLEDVFADADVSNPNNPANPESISRSVDPMNRHRHPLLRDNDDRQKNSGVTKDRSDWLSNVLLNSGSFLRVELALPGVPGPYYVKWSVCSIDETDCAQLGLAGNDIDANGRSFVVTLTANDLGLLDIRNINSLPRRGPLAVRFEIYRDVWGRDPLIWRVTRPLDELIQRGSENIRSIRQPPLRARLSYRK